MCSTWPWKIAWSIAAAPGSASATRGSARDGTKPGSSSRKIPTFWRRFGRRLWRSGGWRPGRSKNRTARRPSNSPAVAGVPSVSLQPAATVRATLTRCEIDGYHYGMKAFPAICNRLLIVELVAVIAVACCVCCQPAELRGDDIDGLAAASAFERVFVDVIHRVEPSVVCVARVRPGPSLPQFNPFEELRARDFDKPESPDF